MKLKNKFLIISISILMIFFLKGCNKVTYKNTENTNANSISNASFLNAEDMKSFNILVHFIDVEQGDCILIQVNNKNMLIDSGTKNSHYNIISYLKNNNVKKLDYFILTHPHSDHIGSASYIINNFSIDKIYAPKKTSNDNTFKNMIKAVKAKNYKIIAAKAGICIDMGSDVVCEMIAPNSNYYENTNDDSAVIKLVYKNNKFLFQGDAEKISENEILSNDYDVSADVLKTGHHGSSTSTTLKYLNKVNPLIAVISCGKNNEYNHPHIETINNLKKLNCEIYRTDLNGNIVILGNGEDIEVLTEK